MNYERKYKEAFEKAKRLHSESTGGTERIVCEQIFPELAESEDERIRKWCISHFKAAFRVTKNNVEYQEYLNKKVIPWLEKQGESFTKKDVDDAYLKGICDAKQEIEKQDIPKDYRSIDPYFLKPIDIDTINPKFKMGDWIFSPAWGTAHIIGTGVIGVNDSDFLLEYIDGKKEYTPSEYVNSAFDKWNIKDAKEGGVLNGRYGTFIFMGKNNGFCGVLNDNSFIYSTGNNELTECLHPATKEQRNLLFQKMREEGYEWDADKKKLKKIEQEPTDKIQPKFKAGEWITDGENIWKIAGIRKLDYLLRSQNGDAVNVIISYVDEHFHLWSIQDAKNGDVLARNNDMLSICIFSRFDGINNKYSSFLCHCGLEGEGLGQELSINGYHDDCKDYLPATKEQQDYLFKKMKEAGYKWDRQNKRLEHL